MKEFSAYVAAFVIFVASVGTGVIVLCKVL